MTTGLVSTLLSAQLHQTIVTLRTGISDTSLEAITGRHKDLTKHLNGRIGDAMMGQKALDDIEREQKQLNLRSSRLEFTQRSLESVQLAGADIGIRLIGAVAVENFDDIQTDAQNARSALQKAFSALSARYGQRQLFSGDATATGPLDTVDEMMTDLEALRDAALTGADLQAELDTYFDDPAGGWQTEIYNGTTTVSDPDAVLAIDPAVTAMIKNLATIALAADVPDDPVLIGTSDVLNDAAQGVVRATDMLIDIRVLTGNKQEQVEVRQQALVIETTLFSESFNKLTSRDQYAAVTELRLMETALESSYLLTSRLSSLNLTNFIR